MSSFAAVYESRLDWIVGLKKELPMLNLGRSMVAGAYRTLPVQEAWKWSDTLRGLDWLIQGIARDEFLVEYILDALPFLERTHHNELSENDRRGAIMRNRDFVKVGARSNKGTIFAEYMDKVEGRSDFLKDLPPKPLQPHEEPDWCRLCECIVEKRSIDREAILVCSRCGLCENYQREDTPGVINHQEQSEQTTMIQTFSYKRENHFSDWLSSLESSSNTEIPATVYDSIRYELKKRRITDLSSITPVHVRQLLKKTGNSKFYEHCNLITYSIIGQKPPAIDEPLKEQLRQMFGLIQEPFSRHKGKRKNFLSYSYVLFKFLQLLERDELLKNLSLLKSREKLHTQDQIWSRICADLEWQFIKSL
jgi:hypothetical protein